MTDAQPHDSEELDADDLARLVADAADDKKATETVVINVGPVLGITEWFVVTSAGNDRLVKTIADEVSRKAKEAGREPIRSEGYVEARWILIDFGDVIVHVFLDEARGFYDLERLWADMERLER